MYFKIANVYYNQESDLKVKELKKKSLVVLHRFQGDSQGGPCIDLGEVGPGGTLSWQALQEEAAGVALFGLEEAPGFRIKQ